MTNNTNNSDYPSFESLAFDKSNLWVKNSTIYCAVHGSNAYGLNNESSDIDLRGVCFGPRQLYVGYQKSFEQYINNGQYDTTIFEFRKFLKLCADANPNALEILFVPDRCVTHRTPAGERLLGFKNTFLSKKIRFTLSGYALSQLRRIEGHRRWLVNPPKEPPTREEFGLPAYREIRKDQLDAALSVIRNEMEHWDFDWQILDEDVRINLKNEYENHLLKYHLAKEDFVFTSSAYKLGYEENFIEVLQKEKQYRSKVQDWNQYQEWVKKRNPKRAAIEKKFGYDCKHASHLVRLMRMCQEVLTTGQLNVDRSNIDGDELKAIKNEGIWTYDELMTWAENQEQKIKVIYESSKVLPDKPDYDKINEFCEYEILNSFYTGTIQVAK
jgi:uncharacterized protein